MSRFSINEQVKAIDREINFRECVYPRRVQQGKMKAIEAEYQLDIMKAIRETLMDVVRNKPFELEGQ